SSRYTFAQKLAACAKSLVQADASMTVELDDSEVILNKTFTTGNHTGTLQHSAHAKHGTAGIFCLYRGNKQKHQHKNRENLLHLSTSSGNIIAAILGILSGFNRIHQRFYAFD